MPDIPILCCSRCGCTRLREDFIKDGPKRTLLKTCWSCHCVGVPVTNFAAAADQAFHQVFNQAFY